MALSIPKRRSNSCLQRYNSWQAYLCNNVLFHFMAAGLAGKKNILSLEAGYLISVDSFSRASDQVEWKRRNENVSFEMTLIFRLDLLDPVWWISGSCPISKIIYNKRFFGISSHPCRFECRDLQKATSNFTTVLGQGAFGPVYKAQMPTGETVAVKVLDSKSKQGEKEFQTEVFSFSRIYAP